jgi:hypothetical protein
MRQLRLFQRIPNRQFLFDKSSDERDAFIADFKHEAIVSAFLILNAVDAENIASTIGITPWRIIKALAGRRFLDGVFHAVRQRHKNIRISTNVVTVNPGDEAVFAENEVHHDPLFLAVRVRDDVSVFRLRQLELAVVLQEVLICGQCEYLVLRVNGYEKVFEIHNCLQNRLFKNYKTGSDAPGCVGTVVGKTRSRE